jgi:cytochrome c553
MTETLMETGTGTHLGRTKWVVAGLIVAFLLGAAGFVWSGFYDVAATSPHFPVTRWLLEIGMVRSVKFHARNIEAPPLDDVALVERGFRHFETACANCHGEAGINQFGEQLLPVAPPLSPKVADWSPAELFWIVKHGIKMTGMPSWEAQERDDEVWAIVAFLLKLPDYAPALPAVATAGGMSAVAGPTSQSIAACARCHGVTGEGSSSGAFPRLSYQDPDYLYRSLAHYAQGGRPSGIMAPVARALTDEQMRSIARHYATAGSAANPHGAAEAREIDPLLIQQGGALAAIGDPGRRIVACMQCHGDEGQGTPAGPALAGQYQNYIAEQLFLWKEGRRDRHPNETMAHIGRMLSNHEIRAVAAYFAALPPRAEPFAGITSEGAGE